LLAFDLCFIGGAEPLPFPCGSSFLERTPSAPPWEEGSHFDHHRTPMGHACIMGGAPEDRKRTRNSILALNIFSFLPWLHPDRHPAIQSNLTCPMGVARLFFIYLFFQRGRPDQHVLKTIGLRFTPHRSRLCPGGASTSRYSSCTPAPCLLRMFLPRRMYETFILTYDPLDFLLVIVVFGRDPGLLWSILSFYLSPTFSSR